MEDCHPRRAESDRSTVCSCQRLQRSPGRECVLVPLQQSRELSSSLAGHLLPSVFPQYHLAKIIASDLSEQRMMPTLKHEPS